MPVPTISRPMFGPPPDMLPSPVRGRATVGVGAEKVGVEVRGRGGSVTVKVGVRPAGPWVNVAVAVVVRDPVGDCVGVNVCVGVPGADVPVAVRV